MAGIGAASSLLKLPIGQAPNIKEPALKAEYQQVYNSLHILNAYLQEVAKYYGGDVTGTPAESLKFVNKLYLPAAQAITAGNIVSCHSSGVVNGIKRSLLGNNGTYLTPPDSPYSGIGTRSFPNYGINLGEQAGPIRLEHFFIATADAAIGEEVEVAIGPGILEVPGATCGQIVWASDSRVLEQYNASLNGDVNARRNAEIGFSGDGKLYLSNPTGTAGYVAVEGINLPGYPARVGNFVIHRRKFLFPVGICVENGFVLINDFIRG